MDWWGLGYYVAVLDKCGGRMRHLGDFIGVSCELPSECWGSPTGFQSWFHFVQGCPLTMP